MVPKVEGSSPFFHPKCCSKRLRMISQALFFVVCGRMQAYTTNHKKSAHSGVLATLWRKRAFRVGCRNNCVLFSVVFRRVLRTSSPLVGMGCGDICVLFLAVSSRVLRTSSPLVGMGCRDSCVLFSMVFRRVLRTSSPLVVRIVREFVFYFQRCPRECYALRAPWLVVGC